MPDINFATLGGALTVLALLLTPAVAATAAPASAPGAGGMEYRDPLAPTVFSDGSTLSAPPGQLAGMPIRTRGTLASGVPGAAVAVQRLDPSAGWLTVATATLDAQRAYDVTWIPTASGRTTLRAVPARATGPAASAASVTPPDGRSLVVYHPSLATWYGPGLFGHRTACGRRLTRSLLGVANRRLPCGTLVELFKDGRTVTVPVVDRGPFRRGASWDLTAATAQALGITTTTTIGVVRVAAS